MTARIYNLRDYLPNPLQREQESLGEAAKRLLNVLNKRTADLGIDSVCETISLNNDNTAPAANCANNDVRINVKPELSGETAQWF